ncbi:prolyl 4-hydroxylase subunit alpha-1-like [Saccostrea cucullata]|uniref:prolyl 4-hydroxylase subunit alpha-1-like n=1 Tax=Saccostrea cuccullata TaxID=36930 RepID=UPI002ED1CA68
MDDLHGAMTGLLQVWSVYHLNADDVIAGVIFGAPSTPLSTDDILLLAEHARKLEFYTKEIALRQEFMKRLQLEEKEHLKHTLKLAKAYHNNKMSNTAMKLLSPLLLTAHGKVKPLLIKYGQAAKNQITPTGEVNEERQIASESDPLCRGITKTPKERSELHCTLRTKIPYYLVKEEVLHVHPRVSLFHEVLSEDDIKTLKRYTAQQVSKPSPAETEFVDLAMTIYQLNEKKFRRLSDKLSRRMSLITGLGTHLKTSQSDVEDFQVVNYGASGQFPLHSDCRSEALWTSTDDNQLPLSPYVRYSGDNIATWIYFMSDVGEGGATIMPNLKVRVTPVKGSALFFYNYTPDGNCDLLTQYGTCPVALGTRWDAVKLIKQGGQIFRRLCDISNDE